MTRDLRLIAAILVGGFVGTVLRAQLAEIWTTAPASWPWATFTVNVLGAFLLGVVLTHLHGRGTHRDYRLPLLTTGFCGALTTFSTLQLELLRMLDAHEVGRAVGYAAASVAAGLIAVSVGTHLARRRIRALA